MTITDEMIEAAAKAIAIEVDNGNCDDDQERWEVSLARAALTAVLPLLQQEWKDISTAPRDGTQVMVGGTGWCEPATWGTSRYHGDGWLDGRDYHCLDDYVAKPLIGVTVWMPLPEPPKP
jgi:hypothetical protein